MEGDLEEVINECRIIELSLKYNVIVLDFDGVMACVKIDWRHVKDVASKAIGRNVESLLKYFRESFGSPEFKFISSLVRCFEERALRYSKPTLLALRLPRIAASKGVRVYIATMQCSDTVHYFLSRFNLTPYINGILGREEFPSKFEMLKAIMNLEGVEGGNIVLIDDSVSNLLAAKSLGINVIRYRAPECLSPSRSV